MAALSTVALVAGATAAVGGTAYSISAAEKAKKTAKSDAKKQQAKIAEQEKLVAQEQKRQDKVTEERKTRLKQNLLLTGEETGVAKQNTLLGAS